MAIIINGKFHNSGDEYGRVINSSQIDYNYTIKDTLDLNRTIKAGIYQIQLAENIPANSSKTGYLLIYNFSFFDSDDIEKVLIKQIWETESSTYTRFITKIENKEVVESTEWKNLNNSSGGSIDFIAPYIGEDNYWYIDGEKTNILAKGTDGKTPTIEINDEGYWVINGEVSTYKVSSETITKPIFKIEENILKVSYDNEITWETIGELSNGVVGANGKSAYEIATEKGFEGDEEEWLASLKGKDVDEEDLNNRITQKVEDIQENIDEVISNKIDKDFDLESMASDIIETTVENLKINNSSLESAANDKMNASVAQFINDGTIDSIIENSESINTKIEEEIDAKIDENIETLNTIYVKAADYAKHVEDFESQINSINTAIAAASNETLYMTGEQMAAAVNEVSTNEDGETIETPFKTFKEQHPKNFYIVFCTLTNTSIPKFTGNALYYYSNNNGQCSFSTLGAGNIQNQGKVEASFSAITATDWPSNAAISTATYTFDSGDIYATLSGDLNAFKGTVDSVNEDGETISGSGASITVSGSGISMPTKTVNIEYTNDNKNIKVSNKGTITIDASMPVTNTITITTTVKDDTNRIDYSISNNSRSKSVTFYQPALITKTVNGVETVYKAFTSENVSAEETFNDLEANTTITYYVKSQSLSKYYVTAEGYGTFNFSSTGTTTRTINGVENVSYKYYTINLAAPGTTVLGVK